MNAIGITRLSTEKQTANDKVSHDEQAGKIQRWCAANKYNLVGILNEVVSRDKELDATDPGSRPVFWGAWKRLKTGEVDAIVFWCPDRFCAGLDGADFPYWMAQGRKYGHGIRFTEDEPPRDGKYAVVINALAGAQAHESWERLIEIMKAGREGHARRGEWAGGTLPFWLRWIKAVKNEETDEVTPGWWEIREEAGQLAMRIISLYEAGWGVARIATQFTKEGVPTPGSTSPQWRKRERRQSWNESTLLAILHNPALYGALHYGGRAPKGGEPPTRRQEAMIISVPALIDRERFEALQELAASHRRRGSTDAGSSSRGWPLAGLIRSEACDFLYSARVDGRSHRRTYRCPGHQSRRHRHDGGPACSCRALVADEIERLVAHAMRRLLTDPDYRKAAVEDYMASLETRKAILAGQISPLETGLDRIGKAIDDLTVAVTLGRLSRDRYDVEVGKLEAERRRANDHRESFAATGRELAMVEDSLDAIRAAVDGGLLHITLWPHGKAGRKRLTAITWADTDDPILAQESFADLARKLHLQIVVKQDGQLEIQGMFAPIALDEEDTKRSSRDSRCARRR